MGVATITSSETLDVYIFCSDTGVTSTIKVSINDPQLDEQYNPVVTMAELEGILGFVNGEGASGQTILYSSDGVTARYIDSAKYSVVTRRTVAIE